MVLDPARYPRAARYLSALPAGLGSLSECQVRAEPLAPFWKDHGSALGADPLPPELREFFSGDVVRQTWIPEVVYQAANLVIRDRVFESDAAHLGWVEKYVADAMRTPFFRAMMAVLSPTLVVMGAAKRWQKAHRGSTLRTEPAREEEPGFAVHRGWLTFPEGLFPELYLKGLEHAYTASIAAAGARNARVTLVELTAGEASYEIRWSA